MDFRFLFSREAMIRRLKNAKPLPTVVMDEVFSDRPQLGMPTVPVEEVSLAVRSMPVTHRGAASLSMTTPGVSISGYEPLPININLFISAADVNTLRQYDAQAQEAWAASQTETLRRTIRNTSEGMAAQAFAGKVEWPIQLAGGGTDTYTVTWGEPLRVAAPKKLDAEGATVADVVKLLSAMRKAIRRKGFGGGKVKVWAGEDAFAALLKLVEKHTRNDAVKVEVGDDRITVGTTEIILRNEEYPHPTQQNTWVPVQNSRTLRMFDPAGGHKMPYCALDDFDAKLAPLPMFIKPIKQDDPSGYKLVGQSKPFPVPNMEAQAESEVV